MVAVIMAGGRGERLWPRSRAATPKQFMRLGASGRTLIQATLDRIRPLVAADQVWVVTGREWLQTVREQLPEVPAPNILVEPEGRNTAACIGLATVAIRLRTGGTSDPVMVVLPSDHVVRDEVAFGRSLQAAVQAAWGSQATALPPGSGWEWSAGETEAAATAEVEGDSAAGADPAPLVTLGIWPTRPETGYGYVHFSRPLAQLDGAVVYEVTHFTEKPDPVTAQRFLADGHYLWNSGVFVWRTSRIWAALGEHLPQLRASLVRIEHVWARALTTADPSSESTPTLSGPGCDQGAGVLPPELIAAEYGRMPSVSIDYGVMEKARPILTIPGSFGWDDVGSWSALERVFPVDDAGNVVQLHSDSAHFVGVDTHGCVLVQDSGHGPLSVTAAHRLVATLGVHNLVVVDSGDVLLIAAKDRAQDIKHLLARIRQQGLNRYL